MFDTAFGQLIAKLQAWLNQGVLMLPNLAAAIILLLVFLLLARIVSRLVGRMLQRTTPYREINLLLTRLVWTAIVAAGTFMALGVLQLEKTVTSLVAGAGVLTLIIGFAFQDLAANFIAGILLQLRHPFRQGQLVRTNDFYGTVEHIDLRNTIIHTLTGQIVHLPNKDVFQKPLENFSAAGRRRVDVPVTVPPGKDVDHAEHLAVAAVETVVGRDTSQPVEVLYEGVSGDTITFTLRFWIPFHDQERDFLVARADAIKKIKRAYDNDAVPSRFQAASATASVPPVAPLAASRVSAAVSPEATRDPH
jgi:small conductance mechanosensitive channel